MAWLMTVSVILLLACLSPAIGWNCEADMYAGPCTNNTQVYNAVFENPDIGCDQYCKSIGLEGGCCTNLGWTDCKCYSAGR